MSDGRRLWLSIGLAVGSPVVAVLLSITVVGGRTIPAFGFDLIDLAFFADGALAAAGSAAGALLMPAVPFAVRAGVATFLAPASFFAHWVFAVIAIVLIWGF